MKYLDEFRDKKLVGIISAQISEIADPRRRCRFMEVCGTHTMAISKYALKSLLPPNIELISGPGCPVCVTEEDYIDKALFISNIKGAIIATFGDMLRVPGRTSSLEKERAEGASVKVVYSTMDALELAKKNPDKKVVFLGIGFETTAPTVAASILYARKNNIKNYFVLGGNKLIPPALKELAGAEDISIDGFILPAHVSAIIGSIPYKFIPERFRIPCVIAGFEPVDIMQGILWLVSQILRGKPRVQIQYNRVVKEKGNTRAQDIMNTVFEKKDSVWRGLGTIEKSGLKIRDKFKEYDAENIYRVKLEKKKSDSKGCICGLVLKGVKKPTDCALFGRRCTPIHPVGPCMVSSEGTCAAYFKYGG